MPPPERMRSPTGVPGLEWLRTDDGSRTLWDAELRESFHSGCGALAESLVVYLINSGVANRLRCRQATAVLEVGFGTATAFLLTAAWAEFHQTPLDYTALELNLLPADVFEGIDFSSLSQVAEQFDSRCLPALENLRSAWIGARRGLDPRASRHRLPLSEFVNLELIVGDARHYRCEPRDPKHAVYFDPFSPDSSPQLWEEAIFEQMFAALRPAGTLTSYCVKGSIRRILQAAGFEVEKLAGPTGGKREVLLARRPAG